MNTPLVTINDKKTILIAGIILISQLQLANCDFTS
jgi:hypothetical protein